MIRRLGLYGRHDHRNSLRNRLHRKKFKKENIRIGAAIVCLICVCIAAGLFSKRANEENIRDASEPVTEAKMVTKPSAKPDETQAVEAKAPAKPKKEYDYSKPVPKSKAVKRDYFDDAVFIGDSRTYAFMINVGLSNATSYAYRGLNVDTVFTERVIKKNGRKMTPMQALKKTKFKKVYIMFGVNETGWAYSDIFIEKYGKIIDEVRKVNPSATIYVQEIFPVSKKVSKEHDYVKNKKIKEYNKLLRKMAKKKKVYYIDTASAVELSDGSLPEDVAVDGIHLNRDGCKEWLKYLQTHTI